jgi:hypothetical protein
MMKTEVQTSIQELQRQFPEAAISTRDDGSGGAYVILSPVSIDSRFNPTSTWIGFHIPSLYPYADIYPVFIGADVRRADGQAFVPPVTHGAMFEGRAAIQVSRRSSAAQQGLQKAVTKVLKVLDFLEKL